MKKVSSRQASGKSPGTAQKRIVYRVTNWATYEQGLIQRGRLDVWVSEDVLDAWRYSGPSQRGAQFYSSDLAIETALTIRKLFKLPLRQTEGFVQSLLDLLDSPWEHPTTRRCRVDKRACRLIWAYSPVVSPVIWSSIARA